MGFMCICCFKLVSNLLPGFLQVARTTESEKLKEEVAVLQKELADLAQTQATMDKLRQEEKA